MKKGQGPWGTRNGELLSVIEYLINAQYGINAQGRKILKNK